GCTWMSIPTNAQVEVMTAATSGTADFQAAIQHLEKNIMLSISGSYGAVLEPSVRDVGNSRVSAEVSDIRKWHLSACLAEIMNRDIVRYLVNLNFNTTAFPEFVLDMVDNGQMLDSVKVDTGLKELGLELSKTELYKKYGRKKPLNAADSLTPTPVQE